jgi:hypothetical protein
MPARSASLNGGPFSVLWRIDSDASLTTVLLMTRV